MAAFDAGHVATTPHLFLVRDVALPTARLWRFPPKTPMPNSNDLLSRVLVPFTEPAYSLLRIICGALFAFHGVQKVFGFLSEHQPPVMSQLWVGGVIELVAGTMIAVGLFTRSAAFLSSGTMAVAYIQFHWKFQFDSNILPAVNRGELAVVYCFVFLFLACRGAGSWSVEGRLRRSGS